MDKKLNLRMFKNIYAILKFNYYVIGYSIENILKQKLFSATQN